MSNDGVRTKNNSLGSDPIFKLIRKFAIPSIISLLVASAYNITDQIFIGNVVGILGNGATNVVFPVITFTTAFSQLVGVGTAANFNINMGKKDYEKARRFVTTGISMMILVGILIFFVVSIFKTQILILCGATENVLPLANQYLSIIIFGLPLLLFTTSSSNLIRADGSPGYSMICTIAGAVLNVFLDWLFMFVFKWGIQGAAVATVIGKSVSFILCISYYPRFKAFSVKLKNLSLDLKYAKQIIKLGTSNFINHSIMMVVNISLNNSLKYYGALSIYGSDIPIAVSGILAKLNNILGSFAVGLAQGCQPILGFNMGAKNYSRVRETYKKSAFIAVAISTFMFLIFQIFPKYIIQIFGSGDVLYFEFAQRYLRIYMFMVFIYGIQPITVNYFTGTGNIKQGIILSLSRQGFFFIPLLLILPRFFGIDGILYIAPISDFLACTLSILMVRYNFKKMGNL